MPWVVRKSKACPASKPWGVFNQSTGRKAGCHKTAAGAAAQMRALYANVPESRTAS
jgi:hypothetical protein